MKWLTTVLVVASAAVALPHADDDESFGALLRQPAQRVLQPSVHDAVDEPHGGPKTDKTIYEFLSQQQRFTKLVHLIDIDEQYVDVLNSTDSNTLTFFAADNDALTPKKRHHGHKRSNSMAQLYEEFQSLSAGTSGGGDDPDERKKRLKKILHALLEYHTLPYRLPKPLLYANATYATSLKAKGGAYDKQQWRISALTGILGSTILNFYARVEPHSIEASNGFLYGINHPLFPSPSILDELFWVDSFSTLTSALQKVGLENHLQWHHWDPEKDPEGDGPVVTVFAPDNGAWEKLPPRLRAFLFSPIGKRVLKKLLEYHIVPSYIIHSDWVHKAEESDEESDSHAVGLDRSIGDQLDCLAHGLRRKLREGRSTCKKSRRDKRIAFEMPQFTSSENSYWPWQVTQNFTVPTLLGDDQTVEVVVVKPKSHEPPSIDDDDGHEDAATVLPPWFRSSVLLNGVQTKAEAVASNGAVHVLGAVLKPKWRHEHEDAENANNWDDWESWLPAWADQE